METITATPDLAQVARWFHALSDETRLRIVGMLAGGERCVCDLQGALAAAQSRLSFHLKTLREAGLVVDRREGRWNYYSLDPAALETLRDFLGDARPRAHGGGCLGACCCS
ncbi:MAG TPA: metalloregulator ArsR/SmtB family transcription factor [Longimicrobiaceae bacterium]|nr:metalloregulator ArsR/SmtB family transcription factor [Longimicrobiaceae bacterium]